MREVKCGQQIRNRMPAQTSWRMLMWCSAQVPGSGGCLVPQPTAPQCSRRFTIQHDLPPRRKAMKISLRTPQSDSISLRLPICKCQLISQARRPPVGLQTPPTAHSYASLLPNSTSTGMRKEPKVFLDYIFGCLEISEGAS